jgi:hypothetical protein
LSDVISSKLTLDYHPNYHSTCPKFGTRIYEFILECTGNDNPNGKWNRFEITVIDDQVSVILNGEEVIKKATINNLLDHGPIGLQVKDFPIEFANIYIREL